MGLGVFIIRFCKCLSDIDFLEYSDTQKLQDCVEAGVESQTLLDNGCKDVDSDGNPELSLHRVGRCAIKHLDAEMLLYSFEE